MTLMLGLPDIPRPSEAELAEFAQWAASRPPLVRTIAERLPPWNYYKLAQTEQIVFIEAYCEDGTVRVSVKGDRISVPTIVEFEVFGINPDDLSVADPDTYRASETR